MAEVKAKFIILACSSLNTKVTAEEAALKKIKEMTGKDLYLIDPEEWIDAKIFDAVFTAIKENYPAISSNAAIKSIGEQVYPTIKSTTGLPGHLKTPLDFIKYEAEGFLANHRGIDVKPRKIISSTNGRVHIEALSPGYDCTLTNGVYLGILKLCSVNTGHVVQPRCVKNGDTTCEYLITWNH